jgi:hypothetical protein
MASYQNQGQINTSEIPPASSGILTPPPPTFGKALLDLPRQYFYVIVNPSTELFLEEKRRASWALIVAQLIGIALLVTIGGVFLNLLMHSLQGSTGQPLPTVVAGTLIGFVIAMIIIFFFQMGIQFLIAKAFRGEGTFRDQCHVSLLIAIPMAIVFQFVSSAVGINLAFIIYTLAMLIMATRAIHNLSTGRAAITVFAPGLVLAIVFLLVTLNVISLPHLG